jgi:hypothetical protein
MDAVQRSPFDTLENCFRLLSTGRACLALDGRRLGRGLPARWISLDELRVLLQHPAATGDLQRAVIEELVHKAMQDDGWTVGLAGVLLPGLRRIAALVALVDCCAAGHVEADLLKLIRDVIGKQASGAVRFALGVVRFSCAGIPLPEATVRGDPLGP